MEITGMQALGAMLTSLAVCAALGPVMIPALHKLKFGQSIRDVGPASHMKKSGTPTMGDIMMLVGLLVAMVVWNRFTPLVIIAFVLTFGHALIGFLDDYIKVVMKRNLGLMVKQKLALQIAIALAYVFYVEQHVGAEGTALWIPGTSITVQAGWLYYGLAMLLLVGTTNAVNLTDGLDGLVSSVSVPVFLTYAFIAWQAGEGDLCLFAMAALGSCLGFLIWNRHPAKVFMGDTGSLALGGAVAALALLTHTEILLGVVGGVYVLETLSVIIQVTYFKRTGGKRVFRMTPVHHHFELGGWKETKVVTVFTAASTVFCLLGLALWAAR
ncbi:MAG: phospho-N-acetylmuramoyl-pentapeptide-transferase [Acidaminococcaceae bacterium]|nr:phospho-N-acetylmuramoyl-pentapeptide-transferase [Acidaminococcaceae bacterium]